MHTILTFITVVKPAPENVSQLEALLQTIQDAKPTGSHPLLPLAALTSLHFGSLTVFHDPADNFDPYLVFEHNFDGQLDEYLDELCRKCAAGLHKIYGHCFDYPASGLVDQVALRAYLRAHIVRPHAYHIGNVGRSAERIKQEAELRGHIEDFLDETLAQGQLDTSPILIRQYIQEFVRAKQQALAAPAGPRMTVAERLGPWARLIGLVLAALLLLPVLLPFLLIYLFVLRRREMTDRSEIPPPASDRVLKLLGREGRIIQNHMASLCYVKPGVFRRATLRAVLYLTNLVARVSYKGKLSGLTSLHFAHWVLIDEGRRLLFLTNYDGSWENYLDDFIDKAALGLTGIWSNTDDFPRTKFLVLGGARDAPRFKAIARHTQAFTNVWYSAYPRLTVQNIDNNSAIREDLFSSLDEDATRQWLARF